VSNTIAIQSLEFVRAPGDYLVTNRVRLVDGGPTYRMVMRWMPQPAFWVLDIATTGGATIVSGAWVRDRTDCILGVSTTGRPPGAIMSYDPKRRGEPTLTSYYKDGVSLLFVPGGMDPNDFSLYSVPVV